MKGETERKRLSIEAGLIFRKKFMESSKYNNFVINFLKYHDTVDVYKIPYTFFSEFIYYSHITETDWSKEKKTSNVIDVFDIIDQFFGKKSKLNLDKELKLMNIQREGSSKNAKNEKEIINDTNEDKYINFQFEDFSRYYYNNMSQFIEREEEDDKESFTIVKKGGKNKTFVRKYCFLSNKLLSKYIFYLSNMENPIKDLKFLDEQNIYDYFYRTDLTHVDLVFDNYQLGEISEMFEYHYILQRCFTSYGLIKFSLLNVFAFLLPLYTLNKRNYEDYKEKIMTICEFCRISKSLVKKNMIIFLSILDIFKKNKMIPDENNCEYLKIIYDYFKKTNLIQTEEASKLFSDMQNKPFEKEITPIDDSKIKSKDNDKAKSKFFSGKGSDKKQLLKSINLIESIFSGTFLKFPFITDKSEIDFFNKSYEYYYSKVRKVDEKNKKGSFTLKTPFALYRDTYYLLNTYLQKFNIYEVDFLELYYNTLCILYYFKIPNINDKWVEQIKIQDSRPKNKDSDKSNNSNSKYENLTYYISEIITILEDLLKEMKNNIK